MAGRATGPDGLSDQEREFCLHYLDPKYAFNGKNAAIAAGYSPRTAASQASRLLTRVHVQAYLAARQDKRLAAADSRAEKVILELERIAFQDIRKLITVRSVKVNSVEPADDDSDRDVDEDEDDALAGAEAQAEALHIVDLKLRDSDQWGDDVAATVQAIQTDGKGGVKLKFHSKQAALDTLARHHGLLKPDEVKVTATDELIALLDQRRDRAIGRKTGETQGEAPERRRPPARPAGAGGRRKR